MIGVLGFALVAAAVCDCRCGRSRSEVVVYTSVDQVFSEPVLKGFEHKTGIRVRVVYDTEETKSTGILNRLLAERKSPQADVFWSGDPVRSQVLVRRGLVRRYISAAARDIPAQFRAADGAWVGFSARGRVLLVNSKKVSPAEQPRSIRDLIDSRWRGRTAIANPAFGTTTMHMAALFSRWGSRRAAAFMAALHSNGVKIATSNGEVKRLVVSGEVAWGLTDTDDAAVAVKSGAPVRVVYPDQDGMGTLMMPTTAVIIKGGPNPSHAKRLIDYLVSHEVEQRLAFAPCAQVPLRQSVKRPAHVPDPSSLRKMSVDYGRVARVMEQLQPYLRDWSARRAGAKPPVISPRAASAR